MKTVIKSALALMIFLVISSQVGAQDYAITTQYDTIAGDIDILLPGEFYDEIQIKTDEDKLRFKSYEVIRFFSEGETYETVQFNRKYHFMKVVTPGFLSYYQYRADESFQFTTGFLYKKSDEGIEIPNLSFRKVMTSFLGDCNEIAQKIENKELTKRDVEQIVTSYNACKNRALPVQNEQLTKVKESDHPAIEKINSLLTTLNDDDLKTLLNDIKSKLSAGDNIPSYMLSALKASEHAEVKELVGLLE